MTALAAEGIVKRYGGRVAVDHLDLVARRGEILALLGPNGAGKTTTMLCLAGLVRPDAGRITLDGVELGRERSRLVGLVPETPEVFAMLTVFEHLAFVARSCRLGPGWRDTAAGLLHRLRLADERDTLGEALSKGNRQKLVIASAVLAGTPVTLFDEPMVGLDPAGQRELRGILRELADRGCAVVVSTHLLAHVEATCDRLLILKDGRAIAGGSIGDLRGRGDGRTLEDVFLDAVR